MSSGSGLPLRGRTVVVTGAASGIGFATAERSTEAGAVVIRLDRRPSPGVRPLDVRDEEQWKSLAAELSESRTQVHGLVNCAGVTWRARLDELAADDFAQVLAVNVIGPMLAIRALAPLMPPGASVVNIGSLAAQQGHYAVAYTASKWALRGLTHAACLELGPAGIRVNIVHPGYIDTAMTASAPADFKAASIDAAPLGRPGTPDEVAAVVTFLLGDTAAYVTGAEIPVDGGTSSHGGAKAISDALRQDRTQR